MVNQTMLNAAATIERPIRSVSEYLNRVEQVIKLWTPDRTFDPWFRGQADASRTLLPSLYRPENKKFLEENDFRSDFKRRAWPYLADTAREPTDEWEWYFLMQHYGLPTRLLDWTESSLVALYFAIKDAKQRMFPAVWMLDPWALNRKVAKKGDLILTPAESRIRNYIPEPFSSTAVPRPPIAVEPPLKSIRITAQRGVFTLHGSATKALDHYVALRGHLVKLTIAAGQVGEMKEQLRVAGITETTVFPELAGLCRELLEYWREKPD